MVLIVEKYVAAPLAGSFNYVPFNLEKPMRVTLINVGTDDPTFYGQLWIYRGTISAYNNWCNMYAVYIQRKIQATGSSYSAYESYINQTCNFILPAGGYTLACRVSVNQTYLKMILHLEDV